MELLERPDSHKLFHAYIRRKKVGCPSIGPLKVPGGELVVNPGQMAEIFVASFSGVFVSGAPLWPEPFQIFGGSVSEVEFTRARVSRVLDSLDPTSSMGPDGLHPCLLRHCSRELSVPLCLIFEKSMQSGVLPAIWRESVVVPIFKGKSHCDPLNYRPVSLTSVCCKSMERIVVDQLVDYLEYNNILSCHQFGFRKGRSTEDQLLLTYSDVCCWVDEGSIVDVVLLDFSKAFDVVHHAVLLSKLRALGVQGKLLDWIGAFLSNRVMAVCVDGVTSGNVEVTSGVPQGSVLGPILFLVYINFVSHGLSCCHKAFADDYKLYLKFSRKDKESAMVSITSLQRSLDRVDLVSRSWNLKLNPEKCVVMRFGRCDVDIGALSPVNHYHLQGGMLKFVEAHKDLGVLVDTTLRFHQHIRNVAGKAGGLASSLMRSTVCREPEFMVSLFVAHVRPLLDYASCVWNTGYLGDSRLLESVQRRWTKQVCGLEQLDYGSRLRHLDMFSIKGRLLRADLIKCWKILHGDSEEMKSLFVLAPAVGTRGHSLKLVVPRRCTDLRGRFFSVRVVVLWNSLPEGVVQAPGLPSYKQRLSEYLGDRLFEFD
jgi:hypothetical protein